MKTFNIKCTFILFLSIVFIPFITNAQYFAEPIIDPFGLDSVGFSGQIAFVDLDNDSDYDLMAYKGNWITGSNYFKYYENIGSATNPLYAQGITNQFNLDSAEIIWPGNGIDFGDLDNDGDQDLICGKTILENSGNSTTPFFINSDAFIIDDNNWDFFYGCENGVFPRFEDMDNDNDLDLLFNNCVLQSPSSYNSIIAYNENIGNDTTFILDTTNIALVSHGWVNAFRIAATDIDLDEDIDVLLFGETSIYVGYMENEGSSDSIVSGGFTYSPFFGLNIDYYYGSPDFADLDNDGDQDLLVGQSGSYLYYENDQSLSVSEENKSLEFSLYPNPATNLLHIESKIAIKEIQFIDLLGRSALHIQNPKSSISVSTLSTGLYMVKITFKDGNSALKKILKD